MNKIKTVYTAYFVDEKNEKHYLIRGPRTDRCYWSNFYFSKDYLINNSFEYLDELKDVITNMNESLKSYYKEVKISIVQIDTIIKETVREEISL